jgi:hypothetical protein
VDLEGKFNDLPEGIESSDVRELRQALMRVQQQLLQAKQRTNELVEVTQQAAHDAVLAMGPILPVKPRETVKDKKKKAEVALWHLTDWQGAKKTPSYNSKIMHERVMSFAEKAVSITDIMRADHPVNDCVIMFGGDMIEGLFNFPGQAFEIDATLFEQYVTVSKLIVDVVRYALTNYNKVTVIPEWGNHGRIGSKRDNVPRSDNFDRMCYELARQLLAQEKRLTWQECPEDIQRVHIPDPTGKGPGYRALLIHGDEIGRNGFASPGAIVQHIARWQSGSYDWQFRDCYIGHFHTHNEWALPNGLGSCYQTGSTESENRYAGVMLAASATPSQRLHFVDPVKGRVTAAYKVWLD